MQTHWSRCSHFPDCNTGLEHSTCGLTLPVFCKQSSECLNKLGKVATSTFAEDMRNIIDLFWSAPTTGCTSYFVILCHCMFYWHSKMQGPILPWLFSARPCKVHIRTIFSHISRFMEQIVKRSRGKRTASIDGIKYQTLEVQAGCDTECCRSCCKSVLPAYSYDVAA